jgi:tetratricopeptide (TPR) repeat protein
LNPASVSISLQLASLLQSQGDFERVSALLDKVAPKLQSAAERQQAAALLAQQGQNDKAVELLQSQNGNHSSDVQNSLMLAVLYRQQGQLEKAESVCRKLLENPDLATIQFAATLFGSQGKTGDAELAMKKLDELKLNPGVKQIAWGAYYGQIGDLTHAIDQFKEATEVAPSNSVGWRMLAACELLGGKCSDAQATVERAAQAIPDDKVFAALKGQSALFMATSADLEQRSIVLSILRDPTGSDKAPELLRIIADGKQSKDNARLAGQLQQFGERHPESLPCQLQLIEVYADMGRVDDSLSIAKRAITTFARSAEPAQAAAVVASNAQRWKEMQSAAEIWKQRAETDPAPADLAIARAQMGQGLEKAAIAQLQPYLPAAKSDPSRNAEVLATYCVALIRGNRADEASQLLWPLAQQQPEWRARWIVVAMDSPMPAAADWLDRVSTIIPQDEIQVRAVLASSYDRLGAREHDADLTAKASRIYDQLADNPHVDAMALFSAGARAEAVRDVKRAEQLYRRALAMDSSLFAAQNNLAMLLAQNGGDLAEAEKLAAAAVNSRPGAATVHDTLAFVLAKAQNFRQAAATENVAISLDPDEVTWRVRRAQYLLDGGDLPEAKNTVRALDDARLKLDATSPEVRHQLEVIRDRISGKQPQAAIQ